MFKPKKFLGFRVFSAFFSGLLGPLLPWPSNPHFSFDFLAFFVLRFSLLFWAFSFSKDFIRVGFWQNGFFADFYFWAAGFFRGFSRRIFSPHFCGKSAQKNPPGKSPRKSSRIYTTKILRHTSADWLRQILGVLWRENPCFFVFSGFPFFSKKHGLEGQGGLREASRNKATPFSWPQTKGADCGPSIGKGRKNNNTLNFSWLKMPRLGPLVDPKILLKELCRSLFGVLSQEMRHIIFFLRVQNGAFWVGAKKFMLKKFVCFFCPLFGTWVSLPCCLFVGPKNILGRRFARGSNFWPVQRLPLAMGPKLIRHTFVLFGN